MVAESPRDVGVSTEDLSISVLDDNQSWAISVNFFVESSSIPAIFACLVSFGQFRAFGEQIDE